jgi:hypothetical protein
MVSLILMSLISTKKKEIKRLYEVIIILLNSLLKKTVF